jgi:hypothetical protein
MNNRFLSWLFTKVTRRVIAVVFVGAAVLLPLACQHIGPPSIEQDRLAYNKAVLNSWEQQTLLNIVRARYDDLVNFIDVGPVQQSHTLMGSLSAGLSAVVAPWSAATNTINPSATGTRSTTDSPSITYTPLTGAEFTRNLTAPLKPIDICDLIESGYRADVFLNLTLYSINDFTSATTEEHEIRLINSEHTTSRFANLTRAIECAHQHNDLNFYIKPGTDSDSTKVFMFIADRDCSDLDCPKCRHNPGSRAGPYPSKPVAVIRSDLRLKPRINQFEVLAGPSPTNDTQIAVRTRSAIAAIRWLSKYVDEEERGPHDDPPPITVKSDREKPREAFVSVQYRDRWYWICEDDTDSKFALIYLRTLLAFADTSGKPPPPVLTIPTR